jgi:chromosome partitioning protein
MEGDILMCKVISCASQKGGVTKTTTVLNLATGLALLGKKILVIDIDPQGSLTVCSGVPSPDNLMYTTYTLLNVALNEDKPLEPEEYIVHCEKIDVIPCNISLAAFELNCSHEIGAEKTLQMVIAPLKELYDVILIDTGPSLGILTVNAISASDSVLITVTPQLLSAIGIKLLIKTITKVQKHINPSGL